MTQEQFNALGEPDYEYPNNRKGFIRVFWFFYHNGIKTTKVMTRARYVYQRRYGVVSSNLCVTHKNGDLTDDRIENLKIMTFSDFGFKHLASKRALPHKKLKGIEHRKCGKCKKWLLLTSFAHRTKAKRKPFASCCYSCQNNTDAAKKARARYRERTGR